MYKYMLTERALWSVLHECSTLRERERQIPVQVDGESVSDE